VITSEEIVPGVHRIEKVFGWGWSLSMHLLALPGGGLVVHSPTWCGEGTFEAIDALGEVRAILAPNHFHHASMQRFRERYPAARPLASAVARPRLERKGHAGLGDAGELAAMLPSGARLIATEEMKNGEVWIAWPAAGGTALVVCDGFFHVERPVRGFKGWVLRRMKIAPGLAFGWTTKALVVGDRARFRDWATATMREVAPRWLIPSHGATLADDALPDRIAELLAARL
jgi:hypothetical protein